MIPENAEAYLDEVKSLLVQRGTSYDNGTERSMAKTVEAFNAITGSSMTEQQGWLFMECLKNVRLFTNKDSYHLDSALDGIAYAALKAESFNKEV